MLSRKPRLRDTMSARARTCTQNPARLAGTGSHGGCSCQSCFLSSRAGLCQGPGHSPGALPADKHVSFAFFSLTTCRTGFEDPLKTFGGVVSWQTRAALLFLPTPPCPPGLLDNISKAIKPSFQGNAGSSAVSGWESQPNYSQLVMNRGKWALLH